MQSTIGFALQTGLLPKDRLIAFLQSQVSTNYRATGESLRLVKTIFSWKREGFASFDDYCQTVWGISSEERANLMIEAWALAKLFVMKGVDEKDLPLSAEVAITLIQVEGKGDICEFWKRLIDHHNIRSITPKTVYKALRAGESNSAIVSNPKHPLHGEQVQIFKRRGESVHCWTSRGHQIFVSPELRPWLAAAEQETTEQILQTDR